MGNSVLTDNLVLNEPEILILDNSILGQFGQFGIWQFGTNPSEQFGSRIIR